MVRVIGITGSIATGKSTVTNYLTTHGYQVIDADELSRQALDVGTNCYEKVKVTFDCIKADGTVDRQLLGQLVFHDVSLKKQLEDIIHPYVIDELKKAINNSQEELLFLDIPLLYEVQLDKICDKIIVVYVDEETEISRLMKRNKIDRDDALLLIHQQISIEEKRNKADYIIDNRLNFEDLYQNIEKVLEVLKDETIYE